MAKADIPRTQIEGSSNIVSVGWDPVRMAIDCEFRDGSVYRYHHVSAKVWEDFLAAPSKGKFVHGELKKREYEKLDPAGETETREEAEE